MQRRGVGANRHPPLVVCLGLATLDVVHRIDAPLVAGRKAVGSVELAAGGPAANAAVTAAALLGRAVLVTGLGDGPVTGVVGADLAAHGVEVVDLAGPGSALPVASCVVEPGGERTVVSPGAADSGLELAGPARDALSAARVVLVDGHHRQAAEGALELVTSGPGQVSVLDAGSVKPHVEGWLPMVDIAAASADYAAGLGLDPSAATRHLIASGAAYALVTQGADEVVWRARDGSHGVVQPPRVAPVDTLGAGDAFHGALVAAVARATAEPGLRLTPQAFAAAIEQACVVAARRVTIAGARAWLTGVERL